jgi:hypothetical protein
VQNPLPLLLLQRLLQPLLLLLLRCSAARHLNLSQMPEHPAAVPAVHPCGEHWLPQQWLQQAAQ